MANLFTPCLQRFTDSNGNPLNGATFDVYLSESQTPATFYLDSEGVVVGSSPLTSNSAGLFEDRIYLDDDITYKIVLKDADGNEIWQVDKLRGFDLNMVQTAVAAAEEAIAAAALAEAAAAEVVLSLAFANSTVYATWTDLAAVVGMAPGDSATVVSSDTGTHTDPVAGGTVDNAGIYIYSSSPAGWERVADLESQTTVAQAELARLYAISDTDAPITGAQETTDRGAKYYADLAETSATSVTAALDAVAETADDILLLAAVADLAIYNSPTLPEGRYPLNLGAALTTAVTHMAIEVFGTGGSMTFRIVRNGVEVSDEVTVTEGTPLDDYTFYLAVTQGDRLDVQISDITDATGFELLLDGRVEA